MRWMSNTKRAKLEMQLEGPNPPCWTLAPPTFANSCVPFQDGIEPGAQMQRNSRSLEKSGASGQCLGLSNWDDASTDSSGLTISSSR